MNAPTSTHNEAHQPAAHQPGRTLPENLDNMIPTLIRLPIPVLLTTGLLSAQGFYARNDAMGGARVASAHYLVAGAANPALLTRHDDGQRFGLVIPNFGVVADDEDELIDAIDDFQAEVDRVQGLLDTASATPADLNLLAARLANLDGRTARLGLGGGLAFTKADRKLAFSIYINSEVDAFVTPNIVPGDITAIQTATVSADLDNLNSEGRIIGVGITDVGLALATSFDLPGMQIAVGVTPKFQRVDTYNYSININNFDDNDFDDSQYRNDDTGFNVDLGAAVMFDNGITVGLVGRNLAKEEYVTELVGATQFTIEIEPVYALGVAWDLGRFLVTADVDLTETERVAGAEFREIRGGVEFDAGIIALRGGIVHDTEDTRDDLYSAGIGLNIGGLWRLDLTGISNLDSSYGFSLQNSFTF